MHLIAIGLGLVTAGSFVYIGMILTRVGWERLARWRERRYWTQPVTREEVHELRQSQLSEHLSTAHSIHELEHRLDTKRKLASNTEATLVHAELEALRDKVRDLEQAHEHLLEELVDLRDEKPEAPEHFPRLSPTTPKGWFLSDNGDSYYYIGTEGAGTNYGITNAPHVQITGTNYGTDVQIT